jgi:hypothetical protein
MIKIISINERPGWNCQKVLQFEICAEFLNWKVVFCILSPVSKMSFELIDLERDEDFSMH